MRSLSLITLVSVLSAAPAAAQLVVADGALTVNDIYLYDLGPDVYATVPAGAVFFDVAADEANEVLYLLEPGGNCTPANRLWRWPYVDAVPTLIGCTGGPINRITFGDGKLYGSGPNLCRTMYFEIDTTDASTTLVYDGAVDNPGTDMLSSGFAVDPSTGHLLVVEDFDMCGSGQPVGLYSLDLVTKVRTFVTTLDPGSPGGAFAQACVGDGKMWFSSNSHAFFPNLDLGSLTWDPAPPANAIPVGLGSFFGIAWAPSFEGGADDCPDLVYCDTNPDNGADLTIDTCDTSAGSIHVLLSNAPVNQIGYPVIGAGNGTVTNPPGAQGDLCLIGAALGRYAKDASFTDGSGNNSWDIWNSISGGGNGKIPSPPGGVLVPGDTWNFQVWHRNGMAPSRFSKAIQVTFQ